MSSWSRNRQFSYFLGLILIVAALVAAGWYWYYPTPTCFDNKQNGSETGVDCGGSCQLVCRNQISPLKIAWTRVFPVAPGVYSVAARVDNPNISAGVKEIAYSFRLVDKNNLLVTFRQGKTFVNPGESFLIVEGGIETDQGEPTKAFLEFGNLTWEKVEKNVPKLVTDKKVFTNTTPARLVTAITNQSIVDLPRVEVAALLNDEAGNAIGAGSTFIENLMRDGSRNAFFSWPEALTQIPTTIDIYPRVNVFDLKR